MPEKQIKKNGFTLLELCIVICILAILASIAVVGYTRHKISQYDNEAIATLTDLRLQASQLISEWGINASGGNYGVKPGCLKWSPTVDGVTAGKDDGAVAWSLGGEANKDWSALGFELDGIQHWSYQLCFGTLVDANVEAFTIAAVRTTDSTERVILTGTGMQDPLVGASCVPKSAAINKAFSEILGVTIKNCT